MDWGIEDYMVAALLLAAAWMELLVWRNVHGRIMRPILLVGEVSAVLAIWAHLAVGII
jgi:hypothetical protein